MSKQEKKEQQIENNGNETFSIPISSQIVEQVKRIIGKDERIEDYLKEIINKKFIHFVQEKQKEKYRICIKSIGSNQVYTIEENQPTEDDAENWIVLKTILVDPLTENDPKTKELIEDYLYSKVRVESPTHIDAIVITHWDENKYKGIEGSGLKTDYLFCPSVGYENDNGITVEKEIVKKEESSEFSFTENKSIVYDHLFTEEPHNKLIIDKLKQERIEKKLNLKGKNGEKEILNEEEIEQLEEWTGKKIRNVIFDSDVDNWKQNTSILHQVVMNKSNLIFLIEDEDDNKFGGFYDSKINAYGIEYVYDPKSFVFSLNSNGRLDGMLKFDILQEKSQYAFYLNSPEYGCLFCLGHDVRVCKEKFTNQSYCRQKVFNYNGIKNALCGKFNFTPKRIMVIQLV